MIKGGALASKDTKERILDAAERLFPAHGFAGTSLRAVTKEAGVNLAAVHYHFGTKEDLLRAVLGRIVIPVNRERLEMLEKVEAAAGSDPPGFHRPGSPPHTGSRRAGRHHNEVSRPFVYGAGRDGAGAEPGALRGAGAAIYGGVRSSAPRGAAGGTQFEIRVRRRRPDLRSGGCRPDG